MLDEVKVLVLQVSHLVLSIDSVVMVVSKDSPVIKYTYLACLKVLL